MERIVVPPYDEYDLSTLVVNGDDVYIGHFGGTRDASGELLESVEAQLHRTLDNLEAALREVDLDLGNVAKLRVMLADIDDFREMHGVWRARFAPGEYPARTVVTSDFVSDEILVQVEGVACIDA